MAGVHRGEDVTETVRYCVERYCQYLSNRVELEERGGLVGDPHLKGRKLDGDAGVLGRHQRLERVGVHLGAIKLLQGLVFKRHRKSTVHCCVTVEVQCSTVQLVLGRHQRLVLRCRSP